MGNKCVRAITHAKSFDTISDCRSHPATFVRSIKAQNHGHDFSLPKHLSLDSVHVPLKDQNCDIFNSHFLSSGHVFESPTLSSIVSVEDGHSYRSNSPSVERCSLKQFYAKERLSVSLASISSKTAIGGDLLNARPIIAHSLACIFNVTLVAGNIHQSVDAGAA